MFGPGSTRLLASTVTAAIAIVACGGSSAPAGEAGGSPGDGTGAPEPAPQTAAAPPTSSMGQSDDRYGPALAHPERYYGVYANPERPNRQWFVAAAQRPEHAEQAPEVPPGHLAVGALFGDVAPWHLRTLSETEFEQAWTGGFDSDPVTVELELDAEGRAVALTFTNETFAAEGRLERVGDLPDEWR